MGCCRTKSWFLPVVIFLHTQTSFGETLVQTEQRKPFFQRLRRLDEQFQRFQDITLTRLGSIAANYNVSYNIDARFQMLMDQYQNLSSLLNNFQSTAANDLNSLKFWTKKLQKKTKKLDMRLTALEKATNDKSRLAKKESQEHRAMLSNLTQELQDHKAQVGHTSSDGEEVKGELRILRDSVTKQENKILQLEVQLKSSLHIQAASSMGSLSPGDMLTSNRPSQDLAPRGQVTDREGEHTSPPVGVKLRRKPSKDARLPPGPTPSPRTTRAPLQTESRSTLEPQEEPELQDLPHLPLRHKIPRQQHLPKKTGSICNVNSVLWFPSASVQNYVAFKKGFLAGIHELSICIWLKVDTDYMGTLLSYATDDNDNKLVLYGRNSSKQESLDFVIGDPAYRQLPIKGMLDSRWHHLCVIWSSIEGRFWQYVDRRLTSTGSKFQKGYEIPTGGTLILGQEQDSVGGGFDEAESFVGSMAGFVVWNRALSPGEVSGIATGKGLPRGTVLTLEDVAELNGSVQSVKCDCLEHCS